ncbi:MAG: phosphodiester glycosidase family protein [Pseudomonadota bacterium]
MIRAAAALLALLCAAGASAATCSEARHEGVRFTTCAVDLSTQTLRLFLYGVDGAPLGEFRAVDAALRDEGLRLGFAMNAGMYHADRAPVGHYVEDGTQVRGVIRGASPGNFGLVPNGVFCIRPGRADVIETEAFLRRAPDCTYATQSGPMLVIDGALHPRFLPDGTSRFVRNGVGTSADGQTAYFVISRSSVNFHDFGTFFRDVLEVPNALYFDGNVSRLHAPGIGRSDLGRMMGPIVGTVVPR